MSILTTILTFLGCKNSSPKKTDNKEIQMINTEDILMTLPTIENSLPTTNNKGIDSLNLNIFEDDWRQLEFISKNTSHKFYKKLTLLT